MLNFSHHSCCYFISRKRKIKKIHMKMLDGSLLFEEHTTKRTKNTQKCSKQREPSTFFSLSITIIISRHSCKISKEYFKFRKTLRNIPKTGPKIKDNVPSRGIRAMNFLQFIKCRKFHQVVWNSSQEQRSISQNEPQNISKWIFCFSGAFVEKLAKREILFPLKLTLLIRELPDLKLCESQETLGQFSQCMEILTT